MAKKALTIIVVAILIASAGVGVFFYLHNQKNADFDLEGCYLDLSGAKSIAVCDTNSPGAPSTTYGVDVSNGGSLELYKITADNGYEKMNFYKGEGGDRKTIEPNRKMISADMCGDFLVIKFEALQSSFSYDHSKSVYESGSYEKDLERIYFIHVKTGKVYDVTGPMQFNYYGYNHDYGYSDDGMDKSEKSTYNLFTMTLKYYGKGELGSYFSFSHHGLEQYLVCVSIADGLLKIEEILNPSILRDRGAGTIYVGSNDVVAFTSLTGSGYTVMTSQRTVSGYSGQVSYCDGYVCKDVEITNSHFIRGYTRINSDCTFSDVAFTDEESYRNACSKLISEGKYDAYRELEHSFEFFMKNGTGCTYLTLNDDLTTSTESPVKPPGQVIGSYMYYKNGTGVVKYDIWARSESAVVFDDLYTVDSMIVQNGYMFITGKDFQLNSVSKVLDSDGNTVSDVTMDNHNVVLIVPLN